MKLSILICTIPARVNNYLSPLLSSLEPQLTDDVELLYLGDNKRRTVGAKRNSLINLAQGEYICFIDDDDKVSYDYVETILNNLGADVICFQAYKHHNGRKDRAVMYSLKFKCDRDRPGIYERLPNHLMVWRKALVVPFKDISYGEDQDWALRMKERAETQMVINRKLYDYYFDEGNTQTQNF